MGETLADNQGQQFNANIGVGCHDCYCFSEGGLVSSQGGGEMILLRPRRGVGLICFLDYRNTFLLEVIKRPI